MAEPAAGTSKALAHPKAGLRSAVVPFTSSSQPLDTPSPTNTVPAPTSPENWRGPSWSGSTAVDPPRSARTSESKPACALAAAAPSLSWARSGSQFVFS